MTPRTRLWLKIGACMAGGAAMLVIAAVVAGAAMYSRYEERAAKYDLTKIDDVPERSAVYDANGEFYSYFGGENRLIVPLDKVSKHFVNALLAREDNRFWKHHGVDPQGVMRALMANARAGETKQGGSTITQQLARNACGLGERSLDRKALEAVLARRIETQYSKEKILELYVNRIYFGAGFYGVETAAQGYFGKPAAELTLGESAALAALIRNPKRLAPSRDLEASTEGRNAVLSRMAELQMISGEELAAAKAQQLKVHARNVARVTDDAIMDAVTRELSGLLAPETIEYGGLRISMTIDPALQRMAEAAADRRLSEIEGQKGYKHPRKQDFVPETSGDKEKPTDYLQAAVVMIDNRTGAIRAAVGGRDYAHSKYQRALVGRRQIGSTFKPFVYATAFERGLLPGTQIDDGKIAAGEFKDLPKKWSPENSDGEYGGLQPASYGLLKSRNTMSVRVGEFASLPKVRETARAVGLSDDIPDLPVVFLGAFETTVRDLAAAYAIFPNHGIYRSPYLISKVEDHEGRVLWEPRKAEKRVISAESAWMITGILEQVMKTGTAAKAGTLGWKKNGAGKTGTTNDFFDAWFVGYTSSMTCAVWVGMDQPETIMEKGYGSALALPIWVDVIRQVPENEYPTAPLKSGMESRKVALCSVSGERATEACNAQHFAYEVELPVTRIPAGSCRTHVEAAPVVAVAPAAVPAPATVAGLAVPPSARSTAAMPDPSRPVPAPTVSTATRVAPAPSATLERRVEDILPPTGPVAETTIRRSTEPGSRGQSGSMAPVASDPLKLPIPSRRPTVVEMAPAPSSRLEASPREEPTGRKKTPRSGSPDRETFAPREMAPPGKEMPARVAEGPSGTRMEVRRAVPVERSAETNSGIAPVAAPAPNGVSERRIVETLPDGRVKTTTIRTIRGTSKGQPSASKPKPRKEDD